MPPQQTIMQLVNWLKPLQKISRLPSQKIGIFWQMNKFRMKHDNQRAAENKPVTNDETKKEFGKKKKLNQADENSGLGVTAIKRIVTRNLDNLER